MADEKFQVHDVECTVLNEDYIRDHYSLQNPAQNRSSGLKAQIVLDGRGNFRRVFCPKFDSSEPSDTVCSLNGSCIYD